VTSASPGTPFSSSTANDTVVSVAESTSTRWLKSNAIGSLR
jgi:hypothetical protein